MKKVDFNLTFKTRSKDKLRIRNEVEPVIYDGDLLTRHMGAMVSQRL